MNTTAYSRRQWIGSALAFCGGLGLGAVALGQEVSEPIPEGYTKPGPVTDLSLAPGLKARAVSVLPNGQKTYALIFAKGDEVMSGLTAFAVRQKVTAAPERAESGGAPFLP